MNSSRIKLGIGISSIPTIIFFLAWVTQVKSVPSILEFIILSTWGIAIVASFFLVGFSKAFDLGRILLGFSWNKIFFPLNLFITICVIQLLIFIYLFIPIIAVVFGVVRRH